MELNRDEAPEATQVSSQTVPGTYTAEVGLLCPNCGGRLEGRKCKLLCLKPGCGYMVTCSEW